VLRKGRFDIRSSFIPFPPCSLIKTAGNVSLMLAQRENRS